MNLWHESSVLSTDDLFIEKKSDIREYDDLLMLKGVIYLCDTLHWRYFRRTRFYFQNHNVVCNTWFTGNLEVLWKGNKTRFLPTMFCGWRAKEERKRVSLRPFFLYCFKKKTIKKNAASLVLVHWQTNWGNLTQLWLIKHCHRIMNLSSSAEDMHANMISNAEGWFNLLS